MNRINKSLYLLLLVLCPPPIKTNAQDKNYQEWYLMTNDSLELYVREVGAGKDTVIVVHGGFGANHNYMLDAIKGLENKYHFILYDQRGSTLSPAPEKKLTFQKNEEDLALLIERLNIKRAKIICHSMGTLVGMEFIKLHPDRVSNLVLIGSLPTKSDSLGDIFSKRYENQIAFLENREEVKKLEKPYKDKIGKNRNESIEYYRFGTRMTDREQTELWRIEFASINIYQIKKWRLMKGGRAYYKGDASIMANSVDWKYDYRKVLNNNGKVTIIMGDYDFLDFNAENHKSVLTAYPKIKLKVIKNAGHNIWVDEPREFKQALKEALK